MSSFDHLVNIANRIHDVARQNNKFQFPPVRIVVFQRGYDAFTIFFFSLLVRSNEDISIDLAAPWTNEFPRTLLTWGRSPEPLRYKLSSGSQAGCEVSFGSGAADLIPIFLS